MKPLSILIVDDNNAARKLLRSVLVGLDQRAAIGEASSGADALRFIKINHCDIVFLDIEMPDMNGLDVLKEILIEIPKQFVVMVSANATIANVKKTVELGGKGFIVKPYTGEKVKAVVDNFLRIQSEVKK